MRLLYKLPLRLHSLFRRHDAELELDDELAFHLDRQIEEFRAQGMDWKRPAAPRCEGSDACSR